MTAYHGGKFRHGKKIADIIDQIYDEYSDNIQGYIEPFCGMCGVYRHIIKTLPKSLKYTASDNHKSLILMWQELQKGWKPPKDCSVSKYDKLKSLKVPTAERGYIGFTFSYGGQFFCGPHRNTYGMKYTDNSVNISNIAYDMKHVKFYNRDYSYYKPETYKNHIIYCDPPYNGKGISKYYDDDLNLQSFNSVDFWQWCREMSKYNLVIISEYSAPDDFIPIYSFNSKRFVNRNLDTKTESLYMYKNYFS